MASPIEARSEQYGDEYLSAAISSMRNKYWDFATEAGRKMIELRDGKGSFLDRIRREARKAQALQRAEEEVGLRRKQLKAIEHDLPGLRYLYKEEAEGVSAARITGNISGVGHADITLIIINGTTSLSGSLGVMDALRYKTRALDIFNFYQPLLSERENLARQMAAKDNPSRGKRA